MSWLSMFKNPYRGAQFSAPGTARRRCAKCDGHSTGMRYDKSCDVLRYRCHDCGYEWSGPTADSKNLAHAQGSRGRGPWLNTCIH